MSERRKIVKNTTLSDIVLDIVGITVPSSSQIEIDPNNYGLWSSAMNDSDADAVFLRSEISNGNLVINDGAFDLNETDGSNFLRFPDDSGNIRINTLSSQNSALGQTLQEFVDRWAGTNISQKPTYDVNYNISYIEFFSGATQTTPNRTAKATLTYDGNLNPIQEVWEFYVLDGIGTNVEKTVTFTHTFVDVNLTKTEMATS